MLQSITTICDKMYKVPIMSYYGLLSYISHYISMDLTTTISTVRSNTNRIHKLKWITLISNLMCEKTPQPTKQKQFQRLQGLSRNNWHLISQLIETIFL